MKNKRRILLLVVVLMAALLAFLLRDVFSVFILAPIAKLLFELRGYYGAVAQEDYWPIVLVFVLVIGFFSLHLLDFSLLFTQPEKTNLHGEGLHGDVYQLAFWLESVQRQSQFVGRRRQDSYSHWYVARTLANLAVDILKSRGAIEDHENRLQGPGWLPPPNIQNYLETGLRSNPVKFKQMLNAAQLTVPDAEEVIRYLESYVESTQ
jgi:hypothetical protein